MFDPEVESCLSDLVERLKAEFPDFREALTTTEPEPEMLTRLMALVGDPKIAARFEALALEAFAPLRGALTEPAKVQDLLVVPTPVGDGVRLNPMYEASLAERLQFDGDIPELRTGPLPEGATPAVPVTTDARDPVALGVMLHSASEGVLEELRMIEARHLSDIAEGNQLRTQGGQREDLLTLADRWNLPEPEGYRRGEMARPVDVGTPPGSDLAILAPNERREAAWNFVSTSHGRRSATASIAKGLLGALRAQGHDVMAGHLDTTRVEPDTVLASGAWLINLGEKGEIQPNFAYVDLAIAVLLHKLSDGLTTPVRARLDVTQVGMIDRRRIGWAARLVSV